MNDHSSLSAYPASIQAALKTRWLGRPMHFYPAVTSTNDLLTKMAADDAPAGTLVITDYQHQGKGRLGRSWLAPAGTSLLFSLLLRPSWPPEQAAWLMMIAGLAAVKAIEATTGLAPGLKWPNDLVLPAGDEWRKVGGLLLEGQFTDGRLQTAILGIGINVNIRPGQLPATVLPATSLLIESGRQVRRSELLGRYLHSLETEYEAAAGGWSPHAVWQSRLVTLGRRVQLSVTGAGKTIDGMAEGTDSWGRLLVRDDAGQLHTLAAGDVSGSRSTSA